MPICRKIHSSIFGRHNETLIYCSSLCIYISLITKESIRRSCNGVYGKNQVSTEMTILTRKRL